MLLLSAAAYQQKKAALSHEVVRMLLNTSEDRSIREGEEILNNFSRDIRVQPSTEKRNHREWNCGVQEKSRQTGWKEI